jgi:hypothetical protein
MMAVLGFLGLFSMSTQRMCMDVAMACMINLTAVEETYGSPNQMVVKSDPPKNNMSTDHCAVVPNLVAFNLTFSYQKVCSSFSPQIIITKHTA